MLGAPRVHLLLGVLALGSLLGGGTRAPSSPRLLLHERVAHVDDSTPGSHLQRIDAAVITTTGQFFLLDAEGARVDMYDNDGRFISSVGSPGREPGQFFVPRSMSVDERGRLEVYDAGTGRVSEYRVAKAGPVLVRSITLVKNGSEVCEMGNRIYLLSWAKGRIVHVYDGSGREVSSFGEPFRAGTDLVQETITEGYIHCLPQRNQVVVSSAALPEVRAYSATGRMIWSLTLPDFRPLTIRDNSDKSVTFLKPPGGSNRILSLFLPSPNIMALQVGLEEKAGVISDVQDHFFSLRDGKPLGSDAAPAKVATASSSLVLVVDSKSPPAASVFHFALEGIH